jgi:hypothetical protein
MFHGDKSKCPNRKSLYHVYPSSISFIFASKDTVHCTCFSYIVNTHVSCKKNHQFGWILPTPRHFSLPRSSTFSCHQGQPWRRWNASDRSGCSQCRCRRGRVHRSKLGTGHRSTMVYLFIRLIIPNEWMKFIDILCSWQCWSWFASSCFN